MLTAIESVVNGAQVKTAIWGRPDFVFDKDFAARAAERLGTETVTATADTIKHRVDGWSFGATHGRIVGLVDENVFTKEDVVVTSAVPFDPLFATAFDPKETIAEYNFTRADGETVAVRMMTGVVSCLFGADNDYRAVKLKLENDLSLIVIVPAEEVPLESIVARIANPGGWRIFHDGLEPATGTVYLPKIRVESRGDAGELLGDAARGPYDAVGSRPVKLNMGRAAATLRLDEFGVAIGGGGAAGSAAAKASPSIGFCSPEQARKGRRAVPELVEANRPFVYLVRNERTGLLVGAGVYEGPPEKPES
jgi:serine protease inhibitor